MLIKFVLAVVTAAAYATLSSLGSSSGSDGRKRRKRSEDDYDKEHRGEISSNNQYTPIYIEEPCSNRLISEKLRYLNLPSSIRNELREVQFSDADFFVDYDEFVHVYTDGSVTKKASYNNYN